MYEWTTLVGPENPLFLLIPVGIIGFWRWSVWLIRRLIGLRYRPQPPRPSTNTVSIITPVYNENTKVFQDALESWVRENPQEIIAVIDHSDTACIEKFKEFANTFAGARLIVTRKPGKRAALVDGIAAAAGDIVILVDSDTVWEQGVLAKVTTPFSDPQVGGVGTRQNVLKPKTLAQWLFDIHLDSRYFDEIKFLAAAGDALTCLSGRTAAYRRAAILPLLDDLLNETFLGKPVISGDDKRLTHLVQAAGWRVRYQQNARVFTPGSPKMRSFLKQRLRWTRNSWRADLRAMYDGWVWKKPALAFHLVDRLFQPVTTLIAPIYFLIALYHQNWRIVLLLLSWWLVSRTFKILPHLRRRPSSIVMVPAYIFFTYVFALFKLFAFFTMNEQGWITRWHSNRMQRVRQIRLVPAYSATCGVVFILGFGMFRVDARYQQRIHNLKFFQVEHELPGYNVEQVNLHLARQKPPDVPAGAFATATGYISYRIGAGDTPELLGRKYGFEPDDIVNPSGLWEPGERLYIPLPFKEYRAYREDITVGKEPAEVTYVPEQNTIIISGWGAAIDIPTLHKLIGRDAIIEYEGDGVYFLKANIFLQRHTLLLMEAPEMSWLKMKSDSHEHVAIFSVGGSIWVDGIKVSSWDAAANDYDKDYEDGRSYLLVRNARMDIANAEVAYLGYSLEASGGNGGVYGLSWRITNEERFGSELTTGSLENSRIHHNYFGMYSFGATGMVIRNNEVFANEEYGLDPHDDSNNFIVEYNYVHDNGNHGIIFSKRCFNNVIRWNRSENNVLHGIMLDRRSNNNSVYENVLVGNKDGVAIWDSHRNDIYDNEVIASQRGVRLNRLSSHNVIRGNQILDSTQYGLYIYDEAHSNTFRQNDMENNEVGVYIRSTNNFILDNRIAGSSRGIYLTDESGANLITQNRLEHNTLGMYLKTRPDDYLMDNTFVENEENIQISPLWHSVSPDWLAARPERLVPPMTASINNWLPQRPDSSDTGEASIQDQPIDSLAFVAGKPSEIGSSRANAAPLLEFTAAITITTIPLTPTATAIATPLSNPTGALETTPEPNLPQVASEPDWLHYLNHFRREANLPPLLENSEWSAASRLHSTYMVKTGLTRHEEDSASPWYTEAGALAAQNSTLFTDPWESVSLEAIIDYWVSTPFSLVPIIDPELSTVGFGLHRQTSGKVRVGATLDVQQGLGSLPETVSYPLPFPQDGGQTWVLKSYLPEKPEPLASCPGYSRVTGPPVILQIGAGDQTPQVTDHTFRQGETELEHCIYDETTYTNPDPALQERGRFILDQRDAIVLIPRAPLNAGQSYTVSIEVNGVRFSWSFTAVR